MKQKMRLVRGLQILLPLTVAIIVGYFIMTSPHIPFVEKILALIFGGGGSGFIALLPVLVLTDWLEKKWGLKGYCPECNLRHIEETRDWPGFTRAPTGITAYRCVNGHKWEVPDVNPD